MAYTYKLTVIVRQEENFTTKQEISFFINNIFNNYAAPLCGILVDMISESLRFLSGSP